ncbi:MAG: aminopeptidase P N-terminal domain-containing protein [Candidatus Babeliales bacterium]|nr:aminopeptidase P N-terminal domain-containing protein [Candidatus Babeliales bacterium]
MHKKQHFKIQEFIQRKQNLLHKLGDKKGIILLFAGFEQSGLKFKQESSFYYFTGINEPACVWMSDFTGNTTLFTPNCPARAHWISGAIDPENFKAQDFAFDEVKHLGEPTKNYEFYPFFTAQEYSNLLAVIDNTIKSGGKIFTLKPNNQYEYFEQRFILERIATFIPNFYEALVDISNEVAQLRRTKSTAEIELLYRAVDITIMGHEAAIGIIEPGKYEFDVQAGIEYVFTASAAGLAFPSIVGSGKNSTVLHYADNLKQLEKDDLVVVDIGAQYGHYCGDLTRTYPVSGKFTKRQKEIYNLVLDTQEYIENIAKPGMWLSNKDNPEQSLNHLSKEFLKERGYDKYFLHGLGHFVGLDVHDVGNYSEPLKSGDIITIEPGIYIAAESIGVRIEDNYLVAGDGLVCLSEHLLKKADDVEELMQEKKLVSEEPRD